MDLEASLLTPAGRDALGQLRADPTHALVALDFDGVLSPIVPRPEDARPLPGTLVVLAELAALVGRVAVVSGRPAADAASRGLDAVPGLVILGHYGLERWQDGVLSTPAEDPGIASLRVALQAIVTAAPPGTTLEDKGHSLAVHTRRTAEPSGTLESLRRPVEDAAAGLGLEVVPGRYVLEVRPPGMDKGQAVTALVEEVGARSVVYAGDDLGDLPAVAALHVLRARTPAPVASMIVCSDSPESPALLGDAADVVVDGPDGVREVLEAIAADLRGSAG